MGRPPKYETPEEMQEAIDAYFEKCDQGEIVQEYKKGRLVDVKKKIPYTVEGLCLALGFNSRQSLLNYENKENPAFMDIIMRAKMRIANNINTGGMLGRYEPTIVKLNMSANFEYSTKAEAEVKVSYEDLLREIDDEED